MVNLRQAYVRDMAALASERRAVLAQLEGSLPDLDSSAEQCKKNIGSAKLCATLQALLRQEHQVHAQYLFAAIDKVHHTFPFALADDKIIHVNPLPDANCGPC